MRSALRDLPEIRARVQHEIQRRNDERMVAEAALIVETVRETVEVLPVEEINSQKNIVERSLRVKSSPYIEQMIKETQ